MTCCLRIGKQIPGIKPAFRMGNYVDLAASRFTDDLEKALFQLLRAFGYGGRAVVVPVIHGRAVFLKLLRDPAPIIQMLKVAEEYAVDEKKRIFRRADFLLPARLIEIVLFLFKAVFFIGGVYYDYEHDDIEDRNPCKQNTEYARFHAELAAAGINENYSDPEHDRAKKYDGKDLKDEQCLVFAPQRKAERLGKQVEQICRAEAAYQGEKQL